ncbi:MAG TPA: hypothetical protein VF195_06995 [Actinomycetota bacterium]
MAAGQLERDSRLMIAVLVALNALAFAAVFDLGGVLRVLATLSLLVVLVAAAMNGGRGSPQRSTFKAWRRLFVATGNL